MAEVIGSGSFGEVTLGTLFRDGSKVAIKSVEIKKKDLRPFTFGVSLPESFNHENVVRIVDVCLAGAVGRIVMENGGRTWRVT
jgi:serine/threonine protein kinase